MSERRWFKPTEGMQIVDPQTRAVVPPEGKWVMANDEFYLRRELDGGGELLDQPPAGAEAD